MPKENEQFTVKKKTSQNMQGNKVLWLREPAKKKNNKNQTHTRNRSARALDSRFVEHHK